MSTNFGDSRPEWNAARSAAAVFDLSQRGQVELSGPDAAAFLHNLCTNDIKKLAAGRGCEFFLTTNKARVVGHGWAHRLLPGEPPVLWLDVDPGSAAKVTVHLNHFIVSEQVDIADRTGSVALLHVCGPQASAVAAKVMPALPALEPLQHVNFEGFRIVRHDRLGLAGFDFVIPAEKREDVWKALVQAGAVPAGEETFNILRVEAGVPVDGVDFDAERFVVEIGRVKDTICYTKGCYLGQEPIVMARDRGHANRVLLGLKVDGAQPLAGGVQVMHKGQEVGQLTSSVWSPLVGAVIALVYLKRGSQEAGTGVEVGGRVGVVVGVPFGVGAVGGGT